MFKCDFHIHTISTNRDKPFNFSFERFTKYVSESELDCVAITNHNIFDLEQYNELTKKNPELIIFPGVEIDVVSGHVIVLADPSKTEEFNVKVERYKYLDVKGPISPASSSTVIEDFSGADYMVIPHYDKKRNLSPDEIQKYIDVMIAGEVSNASKFFRYNKKANKKVVPWLSSDYRVCETNEFVNVSNFTYVESADPSFRKIKNSIKQGKVLLNKDGNELIKSELLGFTFHPQLNVLLGARSSGKTYYLDKISKVMQPDTVKYIRQFDLIESTSDTEQNNQKSFEEKLKIENQSHFNEYIEDFSRVISDVSSINLEQNDKDFDAYCQSIINFARNSHANDSFSNHPLYLSPLYELSKTTYLEELINSANKLLSDENYSEIFDEHLSREAFTRYLLKLALIHDELTLSNKILNDANIIIKKIKDDFSSESNIDPILEFSTVNYLLEGAKIKQFEKICNNIVQESAIYHKDLSGKFKLEIKKRMPNDASELRQLNNVKKGKYADGVNLLKDFKFYEFLKWALNQEYIAHNNIYRLFLHADYDLLNDYNLKVSGGERTEYRLLNEMEDAKNYEILLIDEPESSFDNIFLVDYFNSEIEKISKEMPVIVATHNNSIGASMSSDYYIYCERSIVNGMPEFEVYTGISGSSSLQSISKSDISSLDVIIDGLEAGEKEYRKRREFYEILRN